MRYEFKITQYAIGARTVKHTATFYDKGQLTIAPRVLGEVLFNLATVCQRQLLTRKPERKHNLYWPTFTQYNKETFDLPY